jgi:hypothetical protein
MDLAWIKVILEITSLISIIYSMPRINVPFIKSRGFECGQACAAMMVKYYYPDFEPDFKEFNKIIKAGKYTFPLQNAFLLDHYRVRARCFSQDAYPTTHEDPEVFRKWFGKEYKEQINKVDIPSYNWIVKEARKKGLFERRKTSFENIIQFYNKGWVVSFVIDWHTLIGESGPYQGHFVVLVGVEKDRVILHDPDEGPNIVYSRKLVEAAYKHPIIADDVFVAMGKLTRARAR